MLQQNRNVTWVKNILDQYNGYSTNMADRDHALPVSCLYHHHHPLFWNVDFFHAKLGSNVCRQPSWVACIFVSFHPTLGVDIFYACIGEHEVKQAICMRRGTRGEISHLFSILNGLISTELKKKLTKNKLIWPFILIAPCVQDVICFLARFSRCISSWYAGTWRHMDRLSSRAMHRYG